MEIRLARGFNLSRNISLSIVYIFLNLTTNEMKGLFTKFSPIVLGLALVLTSCGDDEDGKDPVVPEAPTVSFTAPGLTISNNTLSVGVTKDSTVVINYSVTAKGGIEKLVQTVDGTAETVSAASGESYNRQVILNIPFEEKSFDVKVEVTDKNEKSTTATLSIEVEKKVPPAIPLTEAQLITMGGPTSPSNSSRWDLDIPAGYSGFSLSPTGANADKVPNMDVFYKTLSLNDTDTETGHQRFSNSGAKFVITELTKAEFDAMTDDSVLKGMTIDQTYLQFIEVGQVIAFQTNLGKRGLMYIDQHYSGPDDVDIIIKMQDLN
jgi:hypothetical protein